MAKPKHNNNRISNVAQFGAVKPAFDPRKEFFAPAYAGSAPHTALPIANDDITKQVSSEIYSQMRCDPEIAKCLTLLVISTLGDKWELLPAYPEKAHQTPEEAKKYDQAVIWRDFCARNLEGLRKPFRATLEDQLMGALSYGYKIAEKIWKIPDTGEDAGKLVLDVLKVKSRKSARFVVDKFYNVLGFVGTQNSPYSFVQDPVVGARELLPLNSFIVSENTFGVSLDGAEIVPREKFAVLALRIEDEDPRGRSILRAAFNSWHLKKDTFPQYLRYLLLTALPLLIGILPENEGGKQLLRDLEGNYLRDANGNYIEVSPTEALATELLKLRDGSVIALKGGSELKLVEAKGDGAAFHKAFEMFDKQMEMSILLQTLATSDAKFNTRAASQVHMSVLDQLIWWLKGCVVDMVTNDILTDIVRYNGGDEMLEFVPRIHFGDTERRDFAKDGQTIAALMRAGYIDSSQLKAFDAQLGAPPRDASPEELQQKMDLLLQAQLPNTNTQSANGSVSNPAPRTMARFPKTGPLAKAGR